MAPGQELGLRAVALEEAYGLGHGLGHKVLLESSHPTPCASICAEKPAGALVEGKRPVDLGKRGVAGTLAFQVPEDLDSPGHRRNHPTPSRTRPTWPRED